MNPLRALCKSKGCRPVIVRPGDSIILEVEASVSREEAAALTRLFEAKIPGVPVVVLSGVRVSAAVRK